MSIAMNNRAALADIASKAPSKMKNFFKDIITVIKTNYGLRARAYF